VSIFFRWLEWSKPDMTGLEHCPLAAPVNLQGQLS